MLCVGMRMGDCLPVIGYRLSVFLVPMLCVGMHTRAEKTEVVEIRPRQILRCYRPPQNDIFSSFPYSF